ncbi:MAG: M15 family metallopeptidase [Cyclobacteriaceae bacterium]|jgi:D-alanyl-D-alanine dipeptidase|nr:M15 family metallopeptidase [Flammeovirgaceae bacterium]
MRVMLMVLLILPLACLAQVRSAYGVLTTGFWEYQRSCTTQPENRLVNLERAIPGLAVDIRYAGTNNFMKERMYSLPRAYARQPVAHALKQVQRELKKQGLGLLIYDAYRPYAVTVKFYESYRDTTYVASPYRGSRHNRGCALDLTLVDRKTGKPLPMPTEFDSFEKLAWATAVVDDPVKRKNRDLLIEVMTKHGFRVYEPEWWHFDFVGWEKFDVLDVSFEELEER